MGRIDTGLRTIESSFLFDDKIFISIYNNAIRITYRVDCCFLFLMFSIDAKEFGELSGFGSNSKTANPNWWKSSNWKWEEI